MRFSKRIKKISSLVEENSNVIDIGCDHGLLDIYLTLNKNCYCIASDVNKNAIEQARNNFQKMKLNIPTYISDGLNEFEIPEKATCVIAGMGTSTIVQILENNKVNQVDSFIIQTNNDYYILRKFMVTHGFYIENELTFIDKYIRYIIIKFRRGEKKYNDMELILGPILIKNVIENKDYLEEKYEENKKVLKNIPSVYLKKRIYLKKINKFIKKLLSTVS